MIHLYEAHTDEELSMWDYDREFIKFILADQPVTDEYIFKRIDRGQSNEAFIAEL